MVRLPGPLKQSRVFVELSHYLLLHFDFEIFKERTNISGFPRQE